MMDGERFRGSGAGGFPRTSIGANLTADGSAGHSKAPRPILAAARAR